MIFVQTIVRRTQRFRNYLALFFSLVPMVPFYRFYLSTQLTLPSKSLTLSSKSTIETVEKGVKYVLSLQ